LISLFLAVNFFHISFHHVMQENPQNIATPALELSFSLVFLNLFF